MSRIKSFVATKSSVIGDDSWALKYVMLCGDLNRGEMEGGVRLRYFNLDPLFEVEVVILLMHWKSRMMLDTY